MATQGDKETFEFDCYVRGYHVTEKHWKDIGVGESLIVCHEENKYDPCAMTVNCELGPSDQKINVGHIPVKLSSTLRFFVKHAGCISSKVRQETYRASNLEQGGLEVRLIVQCAILSQKGQIIKRLIF